MHTSVAPSGLGIIGELRDFVPDLTVVTLRDAL
jgi:hypothetical protein